MMESNEVEQLFQEKGFQRRAKLINSDDLEFEITETDSEKIRDTIGALNHNFQGEKKIRVKSVFNLSGKNNPGLNLSNCIFEEHVSLNDSNYESEQYFMNCEFRKGINFTKAKFKNNVRFHKSKFYGKSDFTNTTFKKLVDFYFAEFHTDQQFHLTDFEGTAIFSNVIFIEPIQFLHNKVSKDSYISFENATFNKGLDLSRSNFWCTLQFWGASFSDNSIEESQQSQLYATDNNESLEQVGEIGALARLRETFRIIKNNMSSTGNHIEARNYHRLELATYSRELSLTNWNQRLDEKSLLWLNSISNDHGLSWWQGLKFTSRLTLIFYLFYLLIISSNLEFSLTWKAFGYTLKHYVELLNLTFWDYQPFGIDNEPWGFIFLFVSRIFIGYGYYQLIQSFRKFGKN